MILHPVMTLLVSAVNGHIRLPATTVVKHISDAVSAHVPTAVVKGGGRPDFAQCTIISAASGRPSPDLNATQIHSAVQAVFGNQ